MIPYDLTFAGMLWIGLAVFIAGLVRGYSGFGFAALVVTAASLVTHPLHFVAVALLCEFLLSAQLWRASRDEIDWGRIRPLLLGAAIAMPPGIWALVSLPEAWARGAIAGFVLLMCLVLMRGWRMTKPAGLRGNFIAGLASGLANGPGMGGLPVAAFFAAQPIPANVFRATLIAYFPLLDVLSIPMFTLSGMVTRETFLATALFLPVALLGNFLGARRFIAADPAGFRRFVVCLLAGLATIALGHAMI
ncbi:sulfite exporter TauE/SafE family protein [Pseudogemmobacter faecipullorum]|uniref:Probable membrane transporter protein n=1 Tax=Pseudogemmobacter faecipullorum TaxID=2755041 RepID=A0ABS8CQ92_9RHOB|nr:sulfite exporter TauE/SafE family protein [Pseudogemmobacter faecipullorum]MCB5411539.1 sulfite exporter TauE/SafE family protein [Pseudogemmobacter faecipullorum]